MMHDEFRKLILFVACSGYYEETGKIFQYCEKVLSSKTRCPY